MINLIDNFPITKHREAEIKRGINKDIDNLVKELVDELS